MTERTVAGPTVLQPLVRARVWRAVTSLARNIVPCALAKAARVGQSVADQLSSRTFLLVLSAPFTGWGFALYVLDAQRSSELQRIVLAGPSSVFTFWFVTSSVWGASAAIVGRFRHATKVWLALLVLAALQVRIESAANKLKGSPAPACVEEQCVAHRETAEFDNVPCRDRAHPERSGS